MLPRQREANFTWSDQLPRGNVLLEGDWWPADSERPWVSVEEDFAEDLGRRSAIDLAVRIGADTLEVTVRSIRSVDWQSMRPNFFMVFPRAYLSASPACT